MTKNKAERLLGCAVEVRTNRFAPAYVFAYADGMGVAGKTEKTALEALVKTVYRVRSQKVFEKSGYRCDTCGKLLPLQAHHKEFRSHGGTHDEKNLGSRCAACHELEHNKKRA